MEKDYHAVLGVPPNATRNQIKEAHRDLSMKYHPDKNNSLEAARRYKEVNEAYHVLVGE